MTVGELIAALSHRDPSQALAIASVEELFIVPSKETKLEGPKNPGPVPSKRQEILRGPEPIGVPIGVMTGTDEPLSPLRLDNHPRYVEFATARELNEATLWEALKMLREAVHARGYNNRPLEFADCALVASTRWTHRAMELQEKLRGLGIQLVNPMLLKTEAAWGLVSGYDSVISLTTW